MQKKQNDTSTSSAETPWVDPDDGEEWTDEMIETAEIRHGDRVIRPGKPPLDDVFNRTSTFRLDPDVLEAYRALGGDWQTRINADLRKARKLKPTAA